MRCDYFTLFLNDYADGYLSQEQSDIIQYHVQGCESCRQELNDIRKLKHQLANVKTLQFSEEKLNTAIANTLQHYQQHSRTRGWNRPTSLALAASIALAFILGLVMRSPSEQAQDINNITMALNQPETVNMVFNSPKSFGKVKFTVTLPENIEVQGYPGQREIEWTGTIQEGRNLLKLPIVASGNSNGVLITRLKYEDFSKVFEVHINTRQKRQVT